MANSKEGLASNPSSEPERVHERTTETHGLRPVVDEQTPIADVKAPNLFERAKEEFEAIVQAIHPKKEHDLAETSGENRHSDEKVESKSESPDSEKSKKSPNFMKKAKEDVEAKIHKKKQAHRHHHHKETHGKSNDIDETTAITEVKGPNVFERAKEEVEAIFDAIHRKKDTTSGSSTPSSTKERIGFRKSVGNALEKIRHPRSHHDKD